ncbi:hypothetical protein [Streptosporangium sp. H16]
MTPVPVREGTFARASTGVPAAVPAMVSAAVSAVGLAGAPVVTSAGEAA